MYNDIINPIGDYMNLKLIRTLPNKYEIVDELGKVVYYCKTSALSLNRNYYIYDENKLQLAEIKCNSLSKIKYKLYIKGLLVDEVIISDKRPSRKYLLTHKNWTITENITFTEYNVEDSKGKTIISMNWNMIDDPYIWNITISSKEELMAIITAITCFSLSKK